MSTRCTAHFTDGYETAIVFRHTDGYPEGAGNDLLTFLEECGKLDDSRLDDCTMLAARYVVFLAQMFQRDSNPLNFLSVRILQEDSADTKFRYVIDCSGSKPTIRVHDLNSGKSWVMSERVSR